MKYTVNFTHETKVGERTLVFPCKFLCDEVDEFAAVLRLKVVVKGIDNPIIGAIIEGWSRA